MTDPQQPTSTFANGVETETRQPAIERREKTTDEERERAAFDMTVGDRFE